MKLKLYILNGVISLVIGLTAKWLNLIGDNEFIILPFFFWILLNQLDNNSEMIPNGK